MGTDKEYIKKIFSIKYMLNIDNMTIPKDTNKT